MKKISLFFAGFLFAIVVSAQQLEQVNFANGANFTSLGFFVDRNVIVRVSDDGRILEWGIEVMAERGNYYAPKLQPYMGRVEYYNTEPDSSLNGKVKSIGTCTFTYYGAFEIASKAGKLKTIGNQFLDYYTKYDNAALNGKLKFAGSTNFDYYSSFENESFRGKLKMLGNSIINYHSSFDDKQIRGKIKSIGSVNFSWYTSLDIGRNGLKSGSYRQVIGNITYILL